MSTGHRGKVLTYVRWWQLQVRLYTVIEDDLTITMGGKVASWLVRLILKRVVQVQVLAGDIGLCSWARHFTPTVPLSTQVHK